MAGVGILTRMFGTAISGAAGFAAGTAIGPVMSPIVQLIRNDVNAQYPYIPPDPGSLAEGVAQGQVDPEQAGEWAKMHGIGPKAFAALVEIANVGPGSGFAFDLWRREVIDEPGFRRALKRMGLEQEWIDDLVEIKQALLTPAELAVMIQRNVVDGGDILPNQPSTVNADVPPMPQVNIDPVTEAAGAGVNKARLSAMARIIGLPASPDLAARMHFRGIINRDSFNLAIKEGNTRGEWAPFLLDGFRQIPTAHEGIEGHLRGWLTEPQMYEETARHGMSEADTDLLYKISGRPVTVHEVVLGLARGAVYPSTYDDVPEPYRKAIQESNIRPEWASIHYHSRFTYPSAFVLRSLAQAGDLGNAQAVEQILLELGWKPSLASQVSAKWVPIAAVALDPHVKKAQGTLFTEAHKAYVKNGIDVPQLAPAFTALGIPADAQAEIVALWDLEKQLASDVPPATPTVTG